MHAQVHVLICACNNWRV